MPSKFSEGSDRVHIDLEEAKKFLSQEEQEYLKFLIKKIEDRKNSLDKQE